MSPTLAARTLVSGARPLCTWGSTALAEGGCSELSHWVNGCPYMGLCPQT